MSEIEVSGGGVSYHVSAAAVAAVAVVVVASIAMLTNQTTFGMAIAASIAGIFGYGLARDVQARSA